MSVSTSVTNSGQPYPSNSSDNQWSQDSSAPQNEQFLVNDLYSINPACSGSSAIYNNPKITNVNHCVNNQMSFNPPNYVGSYNPNGLNGQDIRFQNTCTISDPGIMVQGPRNGHFIPSVSSSWASPIRRDRMVSKPTWNTTKTTSGGVKKTKRIRTAFTSQQMMELENEYARARYLDRSRRIELSETLKLNERTIKIWFQNRRMKEKKDKAEANEDEEATSTTEFTQEPVGRTIMYDPYPNNGVFERNMYVQQYPMVSTQAHHDNVPTLAENIDNTTFNSYPTFVVENNTQLVDYDMQCRQINMQMQNYAVSPKDDSGDFKEEPIEESSTSDNSTNNYVPKNSDMTENWDLSWIRSIQIEEDS